MSMNPHEKLAHQRLSVLQLAEALGNVSVACRQRGMTRTQFYDYKRTTSAALSCKGWRAARICRRSTRAIRRRRHPRWWSVSWR